MPAPSQLSIATSAVARLVKEEASYHKEVEQQKVRVSKLETANGDEYELRQEVKMFLQETNDAHTDRKPQRQALEETHKVFPSLHQRIQEAVAKLEQQLVCHPWDQIEFFIIDDQQAQDKGPGDRSTPEEITKAKEAIASAKTAIRQTA